MGLSDYTAHQQGIIKRYYRNMDAIQRQRLSEMVTDLFLAEGKKREKVWERLILTMQKLGIPQSRIDHLRKKDDAALVANLVKELESDD